jgi:hypothetical protein
MASVSTVAVVHCCWFKLNQRGVGVSGDPEWCEWQGNEDGENDLFSNSGQIIFQGTVPQSSHLKAQ